MSLVLDLLHKNHCSATLTALLGITHHQHPSVEQLLFQGIHRNSFKTGLICMSFTSQWCSHVLEQHLH